MSDYPDAELAERFEMDVEADADCWRLSGLDESVYDADGNRYVVCAVIEDWGVDGESRTSNLEILFRPEPPGRPSFSGAYANLNEAIHAYYYQLIAPEGVVLGHGLLQDPPDIDIEGLMASGLYD